MLATIVISLNVIALAAIALVSLAMGYWLGVAKRTKILKKIQQLETEMLNSHAEILKLSKEIADKEMEQSKTLVVSLHDSNPKKSRENRLSP